jgi:hypothetical protein
MPRAAPRISPRLLRELENLAAGSASVAEICRLVGATAERLGLPLPSYEQIRVHVHAARRWRRVHHSGRDVALDVAFRVKPPTAVLDHLAGTD